MKIKDCKCNCGHNDFFFADKGNQKGIYCSYCGKWLKWADKDERNLELKQEPILDKIRTEIKEQIAYYDNEHKTYGSEEDFGIAFGLQNALEIIDKEVSDADSN